MQSLSQLLIIYNYYSFRRCGLNRSVHVTFRSSSRKQRNH